MRYREAKNVYVRPLDLINVQSILPIKYYFSFWWFLQ